MIQCDYQQIERSLIMGRRFYHQQRAAQYAAEKIVIDNWLDKSTAEKSAAYAATVAITGNKKSNVGSEPGYIIPFGYLQTKKVWLQVGIVKEGTDLAATEEAENAMITLIRGTILPTGGYATLTKPVEAGAFITDVSRKKIKVARLKLVKASGSPLATKVVSRITARPYTYTKKNSVSCPFGQKAGGTGDDITFEGISKIFEGLTTGTGSLADHFVYTTPQGKLPISVA